MTSPLLTMPGAVDGSGPDEGVAWHYGDPHAEQRALEARAAFVDQSQLGVVTVTGPDRLSWLDSLCTQAVGALAPGQSAELMILSPQGRVEHVAGIVDDGETAWLISETAPALATFLDRMRFMLRVEVADGLGDAVGREVRRVRATPHRHPCDNVREPAFAFRRLAEVEQQVELRLDPLERILGLGQIDVELGVR